MSSFLLQFKYAVLVPLRERQFLFWMVAFPIMLFTVYSLAFSGLDNTADMKIDFGVTADNVLEPILASTGAFNITREDDSVLRQKLLDGEIDGYLDKDYVLFTSNSEISKDVSSLIINGIKNHGVATVIKYKAEIALDATDDSIIAMSLGEIAPYMLSAYQKAAASNDVENLMFKSRIDYKNQSGGVLRIVMFSTFAMIAMYGIYFGINNAEYMQSYLNPVALRIGVSPCKKRSIVFTMFLVGVLFSVILDLIIILYVNFVLGVSLFSEYKMTVLILVIAAVFSNVLGIVIGSIKTGAKNKKEPIVANVLVFIALFSGMYGGLNNVRYLEKNAPFLNWINPIYLINKSIYRVNYLNTSEGVYYYMGILLVFSAVLLGLMVLILRRKTYDSL